MTLVWTASAMPASPTPPASNFEPPRRATPAAVVPTARMTPIRSPVAATAVPTFGPSGATAIATVVRVVDGDTIRVALGGAEFVVRYIGIDTPEVDADDDDLAELAALATDANEELVAGRTVLLERDVSETDRYGRLLRHVWIEQDGGWLLVSLELLRLGWANVTTYPPDVGHVDRFTAAQAEARDRALGIWAPDPTPEPSPTPGSVSDDAAREIDTEVRERFEGSVGEYAWTALSFASDRVTLRWSVTAPEESACRLDWQIEPPYEAGPDATVTVAAGENESGNRRLDTPFGDAALLVTSTCATWHLSMQGYVAPVSNGGASNCDPSYPGVCIPPYPPDLDCGEISYRRFEVRGADPHRFDADHDGIGCESG